MSCIFCDIVAGTSPAAIIYEDETTLSFMDIHQTNDGHCLVIPKAHYATIDDLPLEAAGPLFAHTALVARALRRGVQPDGVQIWQSNGAAAGQEIDHIHLHVFPRYHGDRHFRIYPERPRTVTGDDLEAIAAPIRSRLEELVGNTPD